jgi:hypothetical protein
VFVTAIYRGVLDRGPDPVGFGYWTRLWTGFGSGRTILRGFEGSAERRGLDREGREPSTPLSTAYADSVQAARQAPRRAMARPVGPLALLKLSR